MKGGVVERLTTTAAPACVNKQAEKHGGFKGDRLLVEYCCSPDSEFGRATTTECDVLRLTEKEDMTKGDSVTKVIEQILGFKKSSVTLWASMPCTGGQHGNM